VSAQLGELFVESIQRVCLRGKGAVGKRLQVYISRYSYYFYSSTHSHQTTSLIMAGQNNTPNPWTITTRPNGFEDVDDPTIAEVIHCTINIYRRG
jgi:hypothetical protein